MKLPSLVLASLCCLAAGCDGGNWLSAGLDPKTEPTFLFWADLQGIEFREHRKAQELLKTVKIVAKDYDVDKISEIIAQVGDKHTQIASQLGNLSSDDVDEEALAYRDKLQKAHEELAAGFTRFSVVAKERDFSKTQSTKAEMKQLALQQAAVWEERKLVMKSLGEKYDKNFNVQN